MARENFEWQGAVETKDDTGVIKKNQILASQGKKYPEGGGKPVKQGVKQPDLFSSKDLSGKRAHIRDRRPAMIEA